MWEYNSNLILTLQCKYLVIIIIVMFKKFLCNIIRKYNAIAQTRLYMDNSTVTTTVTSYLNARFAFVSWSAESVKRFGYKPITNLRNGFLWERTER